MKTILAHYLWLTLLVSTIMIMSLVLSGCDQPATEPPPPAEPATVEVITQFSEPPMLAERVRAGKLPPVEERLPTNPLVSKAPEIGAYSDVLAHNIFVGIDYPMNMYIVGQANRTQGAFFQSLAIWSLDEEPVLEPDLAESWEFSEDGRVITVYLRQGVKWSDGVPFTVDDILFTYYDVILNDDLVNPHSILIRRMLPIGGATEMGKIDDYTFKIVMPQPHPTLIADMFVPGEGPVFYILPKHEMPGFGHGIMYCLDRDRLPIGVLPVMSHNLPSFQRKTGATQPLPWQVEWLRLVDDYEAGKIEEEAALRQITHLIGQDGWRGTIPMGGVRAFTVFRRDIGNNPRGYHPYLSQHKGPHLSYSWNGFVHHRIWEWYQIK
jgi:hypothetical protein